MKRLSAILMCVILVLSMTVVAVGAVDTHSITITNGKNGETYTAYKIFDVTYSSTDPKSYSYTISTSNPWYSVVTTGKDTDSAKGPATADADDIFYAHGLKFTPVATSGNPATVYNVEQVKNATANADAFNVETFAAYLYKNVGGKAEAGHVAYSASAQSISVTDDGYYFVTTSFGTLCDLNTTEPNVNITEKNSDHTIDKEVKEDSDNNYYGANDAQIGDTVEFQTTVNIKKGAKNLVLHDTMDAGLTPNVTSVSIDGLTKDTHYSVAATPASGTTTGFDLTFEQTYLDSLTADTDVVVTYTAQLNENAVIGGNGNVNHTHLTYGDHQTTAEDTTTTYTYEFTVIKNDDSTPANKLAGAKFKLYYSNGTDEVQFVATATAGTYRVATPEEIADTNVTKITEITTVANQDIKYIGLDADTYILKETVAPDGFNILPRTITVQIAGVNGTTKVEQTAAEGSNPATYFDNGTVFQRSDGQSSTVNNPATGNVKADKTITVVNTKGGLLPTTGGLGTTIFYTVGGLLVVGAVILLISRKRMKKNA